MNPRPTVERRFLFFIFICARCFCAPESNSQSRSEPEPINRSTAAERPSILFILADDLDYGDFGCYGAPHSPWHRNLPARHHFRLRSSSILRLAGVTEFPGGEDGIDLLPLLTEKSDPSERTFFWCRIKGPIRKSADEHWALREGDWKFIRFTSGDQFLFDLSNHPSEKINLLKDHSKRAQHLSTAIDDWEKEIR